MEIEQLFKFYRKNQVVIYGDILGFKNFVINNAENNNLPQKVGSIKCYVDVFHMLDTRYITDEYRKNMGVNFIWLSDSFAFAGDVSNWDRLKEKFLDFACELYCMGFVFKGAISFGDMHNEANMMGQPLVEAVKLENTIHMPRVIISKNALNVIPFTENELFVDNSTDNESHNYSIYFDYNYALLQQRANKRCFDSTFRVVREIILQGLKNEKEEIRNKYKSLLYDLKKSLKKVKVKDSKDQKLINIFLEKE